MEATQPNLKTLSEVYLSGEPEEFSLVLEGPLFQLLRVRASLPSAELLGTGGIQSLADLGNSYQIVREMHIVPFELQDISRLAIATAAPLLPLLLTIFSFEELMIRIFKVMF